MIDTIPGLAEWLRTLDFPLIIAISVLSVIVTNYTEDRYDMIAPWVIGALLSFTIEDAAGDFSIRAALYRAAMYGTGGFFFYYWWRNSITGWAVGTTVKVRDEDVKASVVLDTAKPKVTEVQR